MLVLTRTDGENIVVHAGGAEIVVTVCRSRRGRASIGIQAPKDVKIVRGELEQKGDAE